MLTPQPFPISPIPSFWQSLLSHNHYLRCIRGVFDAFRSLSCRCASTTIFPRAYWSVIRGKEGRYGIDAYKVGSAYARCFVFGYGVTDCADLDDLFGGSFGVEARSGESQLRGGSQGAIEEILPFAESHSRNDANLGVPESARTE